MPFEVDFYVLKPFILRQLFRYFCLYLSARKVSLVVSHDRSAVVLIIELEELENEGQLLLIISIEEEDSP